jgi:hypothetical protein
MKKLDQGPLHTKGPETDMSRTGIEPGPRQWEASTLENSYSTSTYDHATEVQ